MKPFLMVRRLLHLALLLFTPLLFFAQDSIKTNVDMHQDSSNAWYNNPVVWLIGAAVFTFLLVVLLRGNRKPGKREATNNATPEV